MSEPTWQVEADPALVHTARFNDQGLIPVIAQDQSTHRVLMLAWMDSVALERTLREGRVTYYSRSRSEYWRKGDTSGNTQHAVSAALDCDGDVVLLTVHQVGPACHTGRTSCFDQDGVHE
jgi:phosphoribosyl-AMP cyclohydrolase